MNPESLFRQKVRKWIDLNLTNVVVMSVQQVSICGDPDLVLCLNGRFVGLELKTEKGKVSVLQEYKLNLIKTKGRGVAFVVRPSSWPEVQKYLLTIDQM